MVDAQIQRIETSGINEQFDRVTPTKSQKSPILEQINEGKTESTSMSGAAANRK